MRAAVRLGVFAVALTVAGGSWTAGQPPVSTPASDDVAAGTAKTVAAFVRAVNAGDAKAAAAVWTADAELISTEGDVVQGRAEIEKVYAERFKQRPGLTATVETGSVRSVGPTLAVVQGVLTLRSKDGPPDVTVFSAVEVKDGDGWKLASVRSWEPDEDRGSLADLGWLAGEWAGTADDGELRATYSWEDGKTFLKCRYAVTKDGKEVAAGTQMIGADPEGGAKGWLFDRTGATAESSWAKDGTRWLIRSNGVLRSGLGGGATNLLVPINADTFTWQSVDRTIGGQPVPDGKPVKMTRVAAK